MATKGRDSPLGLLSARDCLRASTPKAIFQRMLGGGVAGRAMGAPSAPYHSDTTQQHSSHNALGQGKGGILLCPAASLPGFTVGTELAYRQPGDIQKEVLKEPVELLGGS